MEEERPAPPRPLSFCGHRSRTFASSGETRMSQWSPPRVNEILPPAPSQACVGSAPKSVHPLDRRQGAEAPWDHYSRLRAGRATTCQESEDW